MIAEWLKSKTGLQITNIPYTGVAPAIVGFERGDVQLLLPAATATLSSGSDPARPGAC